jgi:hypothetical protein
MLLICSMTAMSATKTWDGGGTDANWQSAANWVNDVAPVANDDLVFPAGAAQLNANNNFFLLTSFNSITIEGGGYTLGGNPIRLANGLNIGGGTHTINIAISLSGAQTFTTAPGAAVTIVILSIGSAPLTLEGDGLIGIGLISGTAPVTKNGLGIGAIIAATGFSGQITVNDGIFVVDASIPGSAVIIDGPILTNGELGLSGFGGTGTIGAATVTSGVISAGTLTSPTGILNISAGITFSGDGAYGCKIGGTAPGANGHDQLNVTGAVNLGNARFVPVPWAGYVPGTGETYVVLQNDGADPINGIFLDMPEGAVFAGPLNESYRITYQGGDGNDVALTVINKAPFDYDADGRSDISVFRPSTGTWYLQRSADGFFGVNFGASDDRIVPADYDGDGKWDVAVYRPSTGVWYVINSSTGIIDYHVFGVAEDLPTPSDYDGDGRADISVFRPSTGTWYRQNSLTGQFVAVQFGSDGDKPTVGDFDGDGRADIAVYRPSTGAWYQIKSSDGSFFGEQFGISTDRIVPADYDGDGKTDIAIYRPADGLWYVKNSASLTYTPYLFGLATDIPVPGDFDGDGEVDIAVFRPSDGTWYIANSSNGSFTIYPFGQDGDRPIESAFGN